MRERGRIRERKEKKGKGMDKGGKGNPAL